MKSNDTYALDGTNILTGCSALLNMRRTLLFFDGSSTPPHQNKDNTQNYRRKELDVYIKSGEYFTTLATVLDGISDHPELQQIVHDLMYLQQNYEILKKK